MKTKRRNYKDPLENLGIIDIVENEGWNTL